MNPRERVTQRSAPYSRKELQVARITRNSPGKPQGQCITSLYTGYLCHNYFPKFENRMECEFCEELFKPWNTLLEPILTSGLVLLNCFGKTLIRVYETNFFLCDISLKWVDILL